MQQIREEIADTIKMPLFLVDLRSEYKEEIIQFGYKLLDLHYRGISEEFLEDRVINRTLHRIEDVAKKLKDLVEPNINLMMWIWINEVVTKWISICLRCEAYEAATNLRKIINFEYA